MTARKCPKCKSADVQMVHYRGAKALVCSNCGYDEREDIDTFPEKRETQREKQRYSPYKTGGASRSGKR
ncbi:hypothetical protein GF345_05900 [Candidatus Woesearchaeota archaeon]|nr:hypothetical protein [Candidatus Woesearchaeota archaeon]